MKFDEPPLLCSVFRARIHLLAPGGRIEPFELSPWYFLALEAGGAHKAALVPPGALLAPKVYNCALAPWFPAGGRTSSACKGGE